MELLNSKTYFNLAKAYAGECQALVRYRFIEYGAREKGYKALAELIDNVVYNEFNHARMFYTYIQKATDKRIDNIEICAGYPFKEKWDLLENLRIAAEDENSEATVIYPEFMRVAKEEGFGEIAALFKNIIQVETCHNKLFSQLYDQMKNGTMYAKEQPVKWKCAACGYEATLQKAWDICPICREEQGAVMLILDSQSKINDDICNFVASYGYFYP